MELYSLQYCLYVIFFLNNSFYFSVKELQKKFSRDINLIFSHKGWNAPLWSGIIKDNFKKEEIDVMASWLPHRSREFEIEFLELFSENSVLSQLMGNQFILQVWTRVGFCSNRGCFSLKNSENSCTFIVKYKVIFFFFLIPF